MNEPEIIVNKVSSGLYRPSRGDTHHSIPGPIFYKLAEMMRKFEESIK